MSDKGELLDENGEVLDQLKIAHDGMGIMKFTPRNGGRYTARWKDNFDEYISFALPEPRPEATVVQVERDGQGNITARAAGARAGGGTLYVQHRDGYRSRRRCEPSIFLKFFKPMGVQTPAEFYSPRYDQGNNDLSLAPTCEMSSIGILMSKLTATACPALNFTVMTPATLPTLSPSRASLPMAPPSMPLIKSSSTDCWSVQINVLYLRRKIHKTKANKTRRRLFWITRALCLRDMAILKLVEPNALASH